MPTTFGCKVTIDNVIGECACSLGRSKNFGFALNYVIYISSKR